jgi:hypothetical protein
MFRHDSMKANLMKKWLNIAVWSTLCSGRFTNFGSNHVDAGSVEGSLHLGHRDPLSMNMRIDVTDTLGEVLRDENITIDVVEFLAVHPVLNVERSRAPFAATRRQRAMRHRSPKHYSNHCSR